MRTDFKMYKYSRGDNYSCHVTVIGGGDNVVFTNINVPITTPVEVIEKMLDDAEADALKKFKEDIEAKYAGV